MPLCPQITNTPVTVTQTADFTVSSVLPVVAATTTQVDAADAAAQQALIDAAIAEATADAAAAVAASSAAAAAAAQASATAANATAASAVTTANSAATAAGTAQSTANTALANAATANANAIAANTAAGVAQSTANGKNKVTYSTSAPGSTANAAGDIWFQYGTTAPNVGRIIAQFTGDGGTSWTQTTISGLVIANIDAGNITTGTLTAAVGISNPSGNFSVNGATGALVATGATITGNVTATSGTFTGTVNAGSGYFGTPTNGFSINSTGLVGVGTGTIVGGVISGAQFTNGSTFSVSPTGFLIASAGTIGGLTLSGSSIASATGGFSVTSAGVLTAISGTIGGLTLASNSISSATGGFSVTSAGALTAISGTIGGSTLASGSMTGGLIQTSSGSASVSLVGSSNSLTFKTSNTNVGHILPLSSFGVLTHYGATADPSGGTFPQMFVGSTNVSISASATRSIGVATTGIDLTGPTSLNGTVTYPGVATGAGTTMVVVTTGSRVAIVTSSERFKEQIQYINTTGWLDKVLAMKPITYKTSEDFTTAGEPNESQIGFLAEDIYDIGGGLEKAVVLDPLGDPFSLSYDRLTVFLTLAIKELKAEIDQLKGE
jgi:hypothetical protein